MQLRRIEDRLLSLLELGHVGLAHADVILGMALKGNEIGYQCCDSAFSKNTDKCKNSLYKHRASVSNLL